jgi:hypothetical protein
MLTEPVVAGIRTVAEVPLEDVMVAPPVTVHVTVLSRLPLVTVAVTVIDWLTCRLAEVGLTATEILEVTVAVAVLDRDVS